MYVNRAAFVHQSNSTVVRTPILSSIFPNIPDGAYDLLNSEVKVFNSLKNEVMNSRSSNNPINITWIDRSFSFLQTAGAVVSPVCPKIIYYPLGGFDVHTPIAMFPNVEDVIAVGLDSFGTPQDICKFICQRGAVQLVADLITKGFDHVTPDGRYSFQKQDQIAEGSIAIIRVPHHLNGELRGIKFFNLAEDGKLNFYDPNTVRRLTSNDSISAVIEYDIPTYGRKRFWYLSQDLTKNNPGFNKFVQNLQFQTLFLKGHIALSGRENILKESYRSNILDPARNNNSRVVSDSINLNPRDAPRFWKDTPGIIRMENSYVVPFGYSGDNGFIFFGSANFLVDSLD